MTVDPMPHATLWLRRPMDRKRPAVEAAAMLADDVRAARRTLREIPPHACFVVSAVFHYLGPAFAVLLFVRVDALGVAWLRIAAAAAVFALWRSPLRALTGPARPGPRGCRDVSACGSA